MFTINETMVAGDLDLPVMITTVDSMQIYFVASTGRADLVYCLEMKTIYCELVRVFI